MNRVADMPSKADPLGEALHFLRMSGVFYCRSLLQAPWGIDLPAMEDCMMLHLVTRGKGWVQVGDQEPILLLPGALVLIPHGRGHLLFDNAESPRAGLFDIPREQLSDRYERISYGGNGPETEMLCTAVRFDHPAAFHFLQFLPACIYLDQEQTQHTRIPTLMALLEAESEQVSAGGETVITRLADVLVIHALRTWLRGHGRFEKGWLAGLQDGKIGAAMSLIHRLPGQDWTIAGLAEEVAMSRSAFAARFTDLVGEPVMQYLTRRRMYIALNLLADKDRAMTDIAESLGYRSEAAFSRAFKRIMGMSPGAARKRADRFA